MNNNGYKLNISSEAFKSFREDFDKLLKKTFFNMNDKGSNSAEITVKMKVDLIPSQTVSNDGDGNKVRDFLNPKFTHKISSVMTTKLEESGGFTGEYELVYDADLQDYVAKPVGVQQQSFFDEDADNNDYYEDKTDNEPLMLTDGNTVIVDEDASDFDEIDNVVDRLKDMYEIENPCEEESD